MRENREVKPRRLNSTETDSAANVLAVGGLLALPTETVYGLAADATNVEAVRRIFEVKGRPADHPLIVHLPSVEQVELWAAEFPDYAQALAAAYWPGPLTLVLPRTALAVDEITGGQDTVALRIPNHPVALEVLRTLNRGVCAPSANRFGSVSPTTADAVIAELGEAMSDSDAVIDGGNSSVGVESTIVDCTGPSPRVLRSGAITESDILRVTGLELSEGLTAVRVPGALASHYSPSAQVLLVHDAAELQLLAQSHAGAAVLAISSIPTPVGCTRLLSAMDAADYAFQLYGALRKADELKLPTVLAVLPNGDDIAVAVRDRLTRAAH